MAKEKEQEMSLNVDDFMSKLAKETTSSRKENPITRINLSFNDAKGSYYYLLFPSKNGDFFKNLGRVKQFKGFSTKKGKEVWFDILDKKDYGTMTEDDVRLYDEVVKLYSQVENKESTIDAKNWNLKHTRAKTFCLIYAHVIKFINHDTGVIDKEKLNKPSMMIFPSKKWLEAFQQACTSKNQIMGSNKWMLKIITNDPKNREAIITTDFYGGQGGYNCQLSFEMDKDAVKGMLPENYDFTAEKEIFEQTDIVREYLSWQAPEDADVLFNSELFKEIRLRLLDLVHPAVETPLSQTPSTDPVKAEQALSNMSKESADNDDLPF